MTIFRVDNQPERKAKRKAIIMKRCKHSSSSKDAENGAVDDGVKRYYGDGLLVRMDSNNRVLEITGDGCRIILLKNSGSVHVVGDGCRLSVNHNVGDIEYTGDGGRVLLGPDSSEGKVKFVGDGGKVIFNSSPEAEMTIECREKQCRMKNLRKPSKDLPRSGEFSCVSKTICPHGEIVKWTSSCRKCEEHYGDETSVLPNQECQDTTVNDVRKSEKSQGKHVKRNEEIRKSSRHPTVSKIVTEIQTDGRCVRKRFSDSWLIINSNTGDDRPVTNAPRTSNKIEINK